MIPAAVTFTPASGKRASSSFISGVTLPHRRRSDPGCSTSVGLRMLPPITPGIDAVVEKSARLAWPVSWKRRSLSVNPTLPGPRVSTALPLPLWPAVITFSRALISVSSHPLLQSCSAMFRPPFNGCPLYGQRHSPCLMLSRCGATSHGNTASGRSSPFRSPSTRPAAVASACPATPAFPDRRSAFPLQRALRRQAGQIQRNGYLAGEVQRLRAVGRDNGQTLQRQLLFSSSCASALRFGP